MSKKNKETISEQPIILIDRPYGGPLKSIYNNAMNHGYGILHLRITYEDIPEGSNPVGLLTHRSPDTPLISNLIKDGCKVVRIGTDPDPKYDKTVQAVLSDNAEAGKLAAKHFANCQFKNVGFVGDLESKKPSTLFQEFEKQALKMNCKCFILKLKSNQKLTPKALYRYHSKQILDWLKKLPKPIAVFASSDMIAAGIYTTARMGGFAVPEDVALLGYGNDLSICNYLPVPLSSVDMNYEEQGRVAFQILHDLILGKKKVSEPIMITPRRIVGRQSTDILAVDDPIVASALKYIWDNYRNQITINEIASLMGVSRSVLTRKFRKHLGRGVHQELKRKRLERACRYLRNNTKVLEDISKDSGFSTVTNFYIAFKKAFGITPSAYRKGINPKADK